MKVLIAVDDDDESRDALTFAAEFLDDDADVHVINVARATITPYGSIGGLSAADVGYPAFTVEAEQEARRQAELDGQRVVQAASRVIEGAEGSVEHGDVGPTICRIAGDEEADLIVLGTHDRSIWSRLWFGSVSDHVVRHAPCAVLVVRR